MTFLEAAIEVLKREGKPLHFKELTKLAVKHEFLSVVGRDPETAMKTQLTAAATRSGADLVQVRPEVFGLRVFPPRPPRESKSSREKTPQPEGKRPSQERQMPAKESAARAPAKEPAKKKSKGGEERSEQQALPLSQSGATAKTARRGKKAEAAPEPAPQEAEAGGRKRRGGRSHAPPRAEEATHEVTPTPVAPPAEPKPQARAEAKPEAAPPAAPPPSAATPVLAPAPEPARAEARPAASATTPVLTPAGLEPPGPVAAPRAAEARPQAQQSQPQAQQSQPQAQAQQAQPQQAQGEARPPQQGQQAQGEAKPPQQGQQAQGEAKPQDAQLRLMALGDAVFDVLRGSSDGRPMHFRQITDVALKRRLVRGEAADLWRALRAGVIRDARQRDVDGLRTRVRSVGQGQYALADRKLEPELINAERELVDRLGRTREATRVALRRRLKTMPASAFELLMRLLLERMGMVNAELIKRGEGVAYYAGTLSRGSRQSIKVLCAVRPGEGELSREAVGELRAGVRLRSFDEGLLLCSGRAGQAALGEVAAAPGIEVYDQEPLTDLLIRNQVGVRRLSLPIDYLDVELLTELVEPTPQ